MFLNKHTKKYASCNFETFPLSHEHLSIRKHRDPHSHFSNILLGKFSNIQKNCKNFPANTQQPPHLNSPTDMVLFYHVPVRRSIPLSIHRTVLTFCAFQNAHSLLLVVSFPLASTDGTFMVLPQSIAMQAHGAGGWVSSPALQTPKSLCLSLLHLLNQCFLSAYSVCARCCCPTHLGK